VHWFNEISRPVGITVGLYFSFLLDQSQGNWGAGRTKVEREDDMEQVEESNEKTLRHQELTLLTSVFDS
jgi:hypothetical protein